MPKPPRRFWTADTHIGHKFVSEIRGFETTEEHDAFLAEQWDATVRPSDIVYVLGDIAINPKRDWAFEWFANRPGTKHLIMGNHDAVHPLFGSRALREQSRPVDGVRKGWEVFRTMNQFAMTTINGQKVMMSHFPYRGEGNRELEERYSEYRLRDEGLPLLHGHTHSSSRIGSVRSLSVQVGVDAWDFTPVSEAQVVEALEYLKKQKEAVGDRTY
jgi:calcineurin-like phosphoesterase family protein